MNCIEKIQQLIDKQNGIGISKTIISKYCGRDRATIDYYLKGNEPTPAIEELFDNGLQKLLQDIEKIIKGWYNENI